VVIDADAKPIANPMDLILGLSVAFKKEHFVSTVQQKNNLSTGKEG